MQIDIKEGAVLKDGDQIATYNEETRTVLSPKNLGPKVTAAVAEFIGGERPTFDIEPANDGGSSQDAPKPKAPKKGESDAVPPAPPRDPQLGDRTPAYVEWFYQYHPKEAAEHYKNRNVEVPSV